MRLSSQNYARAMFVGMVLAVWPVWRWYAMRMTDRSDEPWGLLALATAVVIAGRNGVRLPNEEKPFVWPTVLLSIYVVTFRLSTSLPRAMLVIGAFALLLFRGRSMVANGGLLALSLPVIATAQFYCGYPLRILAAEASVATLRALHFVVTREGSMLHWRGETIMVDAPCSGVRMLWFGLYLAATIAAWNKLDNLRSALVFVAALALVVGANVIRATALFFKEAHIIALPEWTHAGIGVALFTLAALLIVRLAKTKEARPCGA
jgi:exosortase/archaeosortase family protein